MKRSPSAAPPTAGAPIFAAPRRFRVLVAVLGCAVLLIAAASVSVGAVTVGLGDVWGSVGRHLGVLEWSTATVTDQIVWSVRVPRTILAIVVGAGLAIAGVVIQVVVRNPLGDPYLIGIVPGASLGAVVVIVLGGGVLGGLSLSAAAFLGGLAAFALVFALARRGGQWPPTRVVLAGVAVGYLVSSFTFFFQTIATPNQAQRVLFWSLGSVAGASWGSLLLPTIVIVGATTWLVLASAPLNALASGTDLGYSLGIDVARFQILLMVVVSILTGCIVAEVGGIGFVGLVIPHIARLLVGADHRRVVLTATLLGACFLPLSDIAARVLRAPAELPIGVVTSAIGAPFFLYLLLTSGKTATR
ncbi:MULTISPECIES: iron ABC transporter permease [Nocardiaceae]|uniref:Iron complex transport system permease protein n=1 Tax=Rhodococcoides corynebacterioides TaxID=53972 RepID=A0ABS2KN99_9NOCA|nr:MULTISPECIES: iron ABC transporter permease [Rhodococcus]MBM7413445.1 iron complex transport system permease protein [Rhodococcus corynebacterioides]MBP1115908.1 iron complex transport system permease protein [Rhodococcus sp. PvP016]